MVSGRVEEAEHTIEQLRELIEDLRRENNALKNSLLFAVNNPQGDNRETYCGLKIDHTFSDNEKKLQILLHTLPIVVFRYPRAKHWQFTFIAGRYCEVIAPDCAQFFKNPFHKTYFPVVQEDYAPAVSSIESQLENTGHYAVEYRIKSPTGIRWISETGSLFAFDEERVEVEGLMFDITESRASREALMKTNKEKDRLFSFLAHELRGPYTGLIGLSDILVEEYDSLTEADRMKYIKYINEQVHQQFKLLENILQWTRLQSEKADFIPQMISLYDVVDDVFTSFRLNSMQKQVKLHNGVPDNLEILADKNMLRSIIHNLVGNAIKFTPSQGKVTVKTVENEDTIQISVIDTGIGMKTEALTKVLKIDAQFTTNGTSGEKGTGLGLLICKEMVEKHHGYIELQSVEGEGTVVTLNFPKRSNL